MMTRRTPGSTLFPYTTLFRSIKVGLKGWGWCSARGCGGKALLLEIGGHKGAVRRRERARDRKSTRLNSSHLGISYAVFCLKKKNVNDCLRMHSRLGSRLPPDL